METTAKMQEHGQYLKLHLREEQRDVDPGIHSTWVNQGHWIVDKLLMSYHSAIFILVFFFMN